MNSQERSNSPATTSSPSGTLKMKDSLAKGTSSQFPPVGPVTQAGSKFFSKGPIKPPTNMAIPTQMLPTEQMIRPHARINDPRQPFNTSQQQQFQDYYGEEYDDEMDDGDYGDEQPQRAGGRMLSPEQEMQILKDLLISAQRNKEFLKVLNILQNDPELRPLIFEHEALLRALKDMQELKAEQMLSILTAAETEMYESSKKHEETQQLSKSGTMPKPPSKDVSVDVQIISSQEVSLLENTIKELKNQTQELQIQFNGDLTEKQKSENEIKRLKTQVKTLQESSKREVDELTRQLNQMAEEMNKVKMESEANLKKYLILEKAQNKDSNVKKEIKDLQESLASANASLKSVTDEKNKLKGASERVKELETQIQQQTLEMKSLSDTNQQLHKKLAQMRASIDVTSPNKDTHARAESQASSDNRLRIEDGDSMSLSNNTNLQKIQIKQEIIQKKDTNLKIKTNDSPQMATFSPKKLDFTSGLEDIASRLINLNKRIQFKLGVQSLQSNKPPMVSVQGILDFIYDIQTSFEELSEQSRIQDQLQKKQQFQTPHRSPNFTHIDDQSTVFSNLGRYQRGNSADDHFDLRSQLLDEKELRLKTQEKLTRSREDQLKYVSEIERLRNELRTQPVRIPEASFKEIQQQKDALDKVQDENVTLKLQIAELETVILDERSHKAVSYQSTVDLLKSQMQQNFLDQKLKYEEALHTAREATHNANLQSAQLEERLLVARDTIQHLRQQISQLVVEGHNTEKENKQLNSALDYESMKNDQILQRTNQIQTELNIRKQMVDKSNFEKIVSGYEQQIASLKENGSAFDKLTRQKYEATIRELQDQNTQLIKKQAEAVDTNRGVGTGLRINLELAQERVQKLKGLLIRQLLRRKGDLTKQRAFYRMQKQMKEGHSEDNEALQERNNQLQNANLSLLKQIGKVLRSVNTSQPVKLNLSGLITKGTEGLDFILSGLKRNQIVTELNLSQNELESDDLASICERLAGDEKLTKLRLANNSFEDPTPLIELLHANGQTYTYLDLSRIKLNSEALQQFQGAILNLGYIQDFALSDVLAEEQRGDNCYLTNRFFDSVLSLKSIRSLDLSKNKFYPDSLTFIFKKLPSLKNLQTLSLSQINLNDLVVNDFTSMLQNCPNLVVLNISGNSNLNPESIRKVLLTIKTKNTKLSDLDLGKLSFSNNEECFKEVAALLGQLKTLKTLNMQKIGLDDATAFYLIESLARAQNLQNLKLDYNKLTGVFVERLCKKLALSAYTPTSALSGPHTASASLLNSESEDTSRIGSARISQATTQSTGLQSLSFEGNKIGDRGAEAIANLIQTKNDASKNIKIINLNECNIQNDGFQKLKQALATRGNLANQYNLTHIGVKVERNPFEEQN